MGERAEWSLTGPGNIGNELLRQVAQPEVAERLGLQPHPLYVVNRAGIWEHDLETPFGVGNLDDIDDERFPDFHFVALPSSGNGEVAMEHLSRVLQRGRIAITAEKAALANNFADLRGKSEGFRRLGVDATVGGGTRLVRAVKIYTEEDPTNVTQIHAAVNGTLSYIMSEIGPRGKGAGITRGEAVQQALTLGYAEPGSKSFEDVVHAEAEGDIPKKTAIMLNLLDLADGELLNWHDLQFSLTPEAIRRVAREARTRRFIVSVYAERFRSEVINPEEEDIIGGFNVAFDGFQVVGGFQNVDHEPLGALGEITGPGNGALVGVGRNESDGLYHAGFGPGAGPSATVNTMLDNYARLRRNLSN